MKKLILLGGLAVLIGAVAFLSARQSTRRGTRVYEEEARRIPLLVSTVKASGEIQPRVYVNISSQVPGEIIELRVKEGDHVRRGDVLVQLDPEQYRSVVTRLEANVRLTRINLERERNSLATHEGTLKRQEALAGSNVVSVEALEQSRLLVDSTRHQARGTEEMIQQAEADLLKARDERQKTTIKAPMDGLVTRVNAKVGEQVIIGTMNNPGTVILVLSDMSAMMAEVKVDETEVALVRPGQRATLTVDALENKRFAGSVTEIAHTAIKERDVSRFIVKVSVAEGEAGGAGTAEKEVGNPREIATKEDAAKLRPGMSAHASIEVASRADVLVVPIQAVLAKSGKDLAIAEEVEADEKDAAAGGSVALEGADVIFVDRDGKAAMLRVKTGMSDEFNVELVDSQVKPGEKVVIGPYRTLKKLKAGATLTRVDNDTELEDKP